MHSIASKMKIPYSSSIVGLRLYFDRIGCTVQEHNRELGRVRAHFEWLWIRKRWCGNGIEIGKTISTVNHLEKHTCSLPDSKQLNPIAEMVFSCIDAAYQVSFPSIFDSSNMTDEIGSISGPKRSLMDR